MNVLYVLKNYPKLSESWVRAEIAELRRRGHRVAVFSVRSPDAVDDLPAVPHRSLDDGTGLRGGVPVRGLVGTAALDSPFTLSEPRRRAFVHYCASAAREFVDDLPFEVDHVHGHFALAPQVAAQDLARALGVPHTVTTHAYDLYGVDDPRTRRFLYRNCDRLVTVSEYNAGVMRQEAEAPLDVAVVPACFDATTFAPSDGAVPNRLLTVARHVEKKGLWYALHAVARLDVPVEYHVVGDGPRTPALRALARRLGVDDRVTFLGRVDDRRLREEYAAAELFVLPCLVAQDGDRDGLPTVLKEAMATGTPPVTTSVSGIPELVDESVGYLVPPRNVDRLADALARGLADGSDGRGRRAHERVAGHDAGSVVTRLLDVFEDVASEAA